MSRRNDNRPRDPQAHKQPLIPAGQRSLRAAAPSPEAVRREQIAPGMGVARRLIFQAATDSPTWSYDMLLAIATAKRLGLTGFEIDTSGAPSRPRRRQPSGMFFSISGESAEEWQSAAEAHASPTQVTVYAVVVE